MSALTAWPDLRSEPNNSRAPRRRNDRRVGGPTLCVRFRGKLYQTLNWSLGGLLLGGYDGALQPGEVFEIDGVGRAGRTVYPVMIQARVVRVGGDDGMELAARFLAVNAPAYDILENIILRRPGATDTRVA